MYILYTFVQCTYIVLVTVELCQILRLNNFKRFSIFQSVSSELKFQKSTKTSLKIIFCCLEQGRDGGKQS